MIGMQMRVDHDVYAGNVEVLPVQRIETGIEGGHHRRVQLRHAGVDQYARLRVIDDVHIDGHQLALDMQIGNEDRRDGDRGAGFHVSVSLDLGWR